MNYSVDLFNKQEGIYGVFLSDDLEIDMWTKRLDELKIPAISFRSMRIFDSATIRFIKNISNLTKDKAYVDALNYGKEVIDKDAYYAYKTKEKIYGEDWKILDNYKEFILDEDLFNIKKEFLLKQYNLNEVFIYDYLIEL